MRIRGRGKGNGLLIMGGIAVLAVAAIGVSMYMKSREPQRAALAKARFAQGGYTIPGGYPETERLSQGGATMENTAGYLRGAAQVPDQDIIYTLKNIRTLDNSFSTGAYVGTGGSAGNTAAMHGEASYKNQDTLRNSTLAINPSVPPPVSVPKISIAGAEYNGSSYLGGIGSPRGPQHALVPTKGYVQFPIAGGALTDYPRFPIAGAYRASSKGFI